MKEKGFTLVELLGVIVILAAIIIVAFPSILGAMGSTNDKVDSATRTILETNAKSYVTDHKSDYLGTKSYCISVKTLINERYTQSPIANVSEKKGKEIEENWGVNFKCSKGTCTEYKITESGC